MSYTCGSCGAPADQRCPTCKELGVDPSQSHFCSKECFAKAWPDHKLGHKKAKESLAALLLSSAVSPFRGSKFDGYAFRGPLRPAPMSPQVPPPPGVPPPDYARDGRPRSEEAERGRNTIAVYSTPEELAALREAGAIAREVTDLAAAALRVGVTGDEIDRLVHAATVARGAYPSPLNYCGFPKSVCVSVNEVIYEETGRAAAPKVEYVSETRIPALKLVGDATTAAAKPDEPAALILTGALLEEVAKYALSWMKKNHEPGDPQPEGAHVYLATVLRAGGLGSTMDADDTSESWPLRNSVSGSVSAPL
jgi:hypothetical protein